MENFYIIFLWNLFNIFPPGSLYQYNPLRALAFFFFIYQDFHFFPPKQKWKILLKLSTAIAEFSRIVEFLSRNVLAEE